MADGIVSKETQAQLVNPTPNLSSISQAEQIAGFEMDSKYAGAVNDVLQTVDKMLLTQSEHNLVKSGAEYDRIKRNYELKLRDPEIFFNKEAKKQAEDEYATAIDDFNKKTSDMVMTDSHVAKINNEVESGTAYVGNVNKLKTQETDRYIQNRDLSLAYTQTQDASMNYAYQGNVGMVKQETLKSVELDKVSVEKRFITEEQAKARYSESRASTTTIIETQKIRQVLNNKNIAPEQKIDFINNVMVKFSDEKRLQPLAKELASESDFGDENMIANDLRKYNQKTLDMLENQKNGLRKEIEHGQAIYQQQAEINQLVATGDYIGAENLSNKIKGQPQNATYSQIFTNKEKTEAIFGEGTYDGYYDPKDPRIPYATLPQSVKASMDYIADLNIDTKDKYLKMREILRRDAWGSENGSMIPLIKSTSAMTFGKSGMKIDYNTMVGVDMPTQRAMTQQQVEKKFFNINVEKIIVDNNKAEQSIANQKIEGKADKEIIEQNIKTLQVNGNVISELDKHGTPILLKKVPSTLNDLTQEQLDTAAYKAIINTTNTPRRDSLKSDMVKSKVQLDTLLNSPVHTKRFYYNLAALAKIKYPGVYAAEDKDIGNPDKTYQTLTDEVLNDEGLVVEALSQTFEGIYSPEEKLNFNNKYNSGFSSNLGNIYQTLGAEPSGKVQSDVKKVVNVKRK
ncbi:MAG: hypothetical protein ACRC0V_05550 [Fusobacteriaceae bacterium]